MPNQKSSNPQFQINFGGFKITSEDMPQIIMGNARTDDNNPNATQIDIQDKVKTYPKMYYTTDFAALTFILSKLTLRSSSLVYAKLNDTTEKKRGGVSQFAGSRFITCFSHIDHESVPFWRNYGGDDNSKKLLKFNNFQHISAMQYILTIACLTEIKSCFLKVKHFTQP